MWIAALVLIGGGALAVGVGFRARAGRLTRQSWVGIRTPTTMESDDAWREGHQAASGWLIGGGVILALGGFLTLLPDSEDTAAIVALVTAIVAVVPIAIGGARAQAAARRAA